MGRPKGFDRTEVLEKAIQVFWKKGFADTSLQDLEKATGVNKSGLYSEFKDKQDLFCQSLKHFSEMSPAVEILSKEPLGWDNIERFLTFNSECRGQKGCFVANSVRETSILSSQARQMIAAYYEGSKDLLRANLEAAGVKADPETLAEILMAFQAGVALEQNMGPRAESIQQRVSVLLEMLKKS